MKPNILLGIPAYGDVIKVKTMVSIFELTTTLGAKGIPCKGVPLDYFDVSQSRNAFASMVLEDDSKTHLLMTDSDMVYKPDPVLAMIDAKMDVIGCVHTKRKFPIEFNYISNSKPTSPISEVLGIGTGLILISKSALKKLVGSVRKQARHQFGQIGLKGPLYGFFDPIWPDGSYNHDDYGFCRRWRESGGKVHALFGHDIGHIGDFVFKATEVPKS